MDEANSAIGIALLHVTAEEPRKYLLAIQNELFDLGADLATPGEDFTPGEMTLRITHEQIDRLEREIDAMNERLEPLRSFILPGGGAASAHLHLARTIVRRAERSAVAAGATLFVLVKGVIGMAQGKDLTGVRSQELMRKRVMFQAIAIVFVVLLLLMASGRS